MSFIKGKPFRLARDRFFPTDAEPVKIIKHLRDLVLSTAYGVDVFNAQQKTASGLFCGLEIQKRRKGMAQMKGAVSGWGQSGRVQA